jgi:hypothetical protein
VEWLLSLVSARTSEIQSHLAVSMATPLLNVEGVEVRLSTFNNAQMQVIDGGLRVSLKNYTGELFFVTKVTRQHKN